MAVICSFKDQSGKSLHTSIAISSKRPSAAKKPCTKLGFKYLNRDKDSHKLSTHLHQFQAALRRRQHRQQQTLPVEGQQQGDEGEHHAAQQAGIGAEHHNL